jgi:hypothetical protein
MNKAATAKPMLQPTNEFLERSLDELAEECAHVLGMLVRLRGLPEGEERDTLEGKLYAGLSHLHRESRAILREWDRLIETMLKD